MSKPTAATRYRVERYDSPLRFHVTSSSRHDVKHLVELDAYHNNGQCSCENFVFRHQPLLAKGAPPDVNLRCAHILQAREFCLDALLSDIAAARREHEQRTHCARQRIAEAKRLGYDPDPEDLQICQ